MTKQRYLEIRKSLSLDKRLQPLIAFYLTEGFLLVAAIGLWMFGYRGAVIPVLAIMMFRNFSLMHDASHGAISDNRGLNNFVGVLSGCLCLLPFKAWKDSHLQHHLWSGNIEKDPVMGLRVTLPKAPERVQQFLTLAWRAWVPSLALLQYLLFWKLAFGHATKRKSVRSWLEWGGPLIAWSAFLTVAPSGFFLTAFLPALALYLVAVEVVNFPHHLQLPMSSGDHKEPVWGQYKTSRTCVYPKWFARHVVLNFNYHSEHHMFPDAPWYELENIHEILKVELGGALNMDPHFQWTLENRSLGLLDVIVPPELEDGAQEAA